MKTNNHEPDYDDKDLDELLGELELLLGHVLFRIRERDARVFTRRQVTGRSHRKEQETE